MAEFLGRKAKGTCQAAYPRRKEHIQENQDTGLTFVAHRFWKCINCVIPIHLDQNISTQWHHTRNHPEVVPQYTHS